MAKLTDKQKKKIIADYILMENYSEVARLNGVSRNTVKTVVQSDKDTAEKCQQKKEENTAAILSHMGKQKDRVCDILDKMLDALDNQEKMKNATLPQIATALGILVDKYGANENRQPYKPGADDEDDPLTKSLKEEAERLNNADQ